MKKQLFEFFPIILFFIAYKAYDIYVATGVVIVASIFQVSYNWLRHRKVEKMQLITAGLILVMGSATIYLQNEQFIKWKLTIIEWLFGVAFLGSQFIGKKPFVERMMSGSITLPSTVWRRLNTLWALFFLSVGTINLYVMYNFDTDTWVNFKTFGVPVLMVIFMLLQVMYLYKYIPDSEAEMED